LIERAVILSNDETLRVDDFPSGSRDGASELQTEPINLEQVEKNHIQKILKECNWIIDGDRGAAKRLGIAASTLRDRMKKLAIKRPQ
jgi:transcriptional regulator of acetoin/glycerol metabolism